VEVSKPLSSAEINELAEFLTSDKTPEECMDISMLDGFLTGLVIGPETIMPSRWLPEVWGGTEQDEMAWKSRKEAERIIELVMRLYNSVAQAFQVDPPDIRPLLPSHKTKSEEILILDEWCWGFMRSIGLAPESWQSLLDHEERSAAIFPISLHGTEEGWKLLEEDPKISKVPHEEWVTMGWDPFCRVTH